jgi:hypothetical protein
MSPASSRMLLRSAFADPYNWPLLDGPRADAVGAATTAEDIACRPSAACCVTHRSPAYKAYSC